MDKFTTAIGFVVIALGAGIMIAALSAWPLSLCWNAVVPRVFGLPEIGVLDAFCLTFVASCLVRSRVEQKKEPT